MSEEKHQSREVEGSDPATWVDRYGDYLYRYAISRIRDPSIAEDLIQETFVSALHARGSFEGRSTERSWFTSILKHKILDYFRRMSKEKPLAEEDLLEVSGDDFFHDEGKWKVGPADWTISPTGLLEQKQFWKVLSRCLLELPSNLARVFTLREMEGWNTEEICKALDISPTNCWVLLYRARMGLRHCLEMNWFESEDHGDGS